MINRVIFAACAAIAACSLAHAAQQMPTEEQMREWSYPVEGVIRHTVNIRIFAGGDGLTDNGAKNGGENDAPPPVLRGSSPDTLYRGLHADKRSLAATPKPLHASFSAEADQRASDALRRYLDKHDWRLDWRAKWDCMLKTPVSIGGDDLYDTLADFLRLFSLSADVYPNQRGVVIKPAHRNDKICQPAEKAILLKAKTRTVK